MYGHAVTTSEDIQCGYARLTRYPRTFSASRFKWVGQAKAASPKRPKTRQSDGRNTLNIGHVLSSKRTLNKAAQKRNLPAPKPGLANVLAKDIKVIARKSVLRIDPSVKRQFCRHCNSNLIPGVTCSVRIKRERKHRIRRSDAYWEADALLHSLRFARPG